MEIDWIKVIKAACTSVNTYIAVRGFLNRPQYKEKVHYTIVEGVFKGNDEELSVLTNTLREMNEHDLANNLEEIAADFDDMNIILESYIKSQAYFNDIVDRSYDQIVSGT